MSYGARLTFRKGREVLIDALEFWRLGFFWVVEGVDLGRWSKEREEKGIYRCCSGTCSRSTRSRILLACLIDVLHAVDRLRRSSLSL